MAKVLLYNLGVLTREGGAIRGILKKMGVEAVTVQREQLNEKTGVLAGMTRRNPVGEATRPFTGAGYDEPVLVISGLTDSALDQLLAAMRTAGAPVSLKAVLTPYNAGWSFRELIDELQKEHLEMQRN